MDPLVETARRQIGKFSGWVDLFGIRFSDISWIAMFQNLLIYLKLIVIPVASMRNAEVTSFFSSPKQIPNINSNFSFLGDGCKMIREGADIHVQCLSDSPIFVQCPLYAASAGDHLATVYRLGKSKFLWT